MATKVEMLQAQVQRNNQLIEQAIGVIEALAAKIGGFQDDPVFEEMRAALEAQNTVLEATLAGHSGQ